MEATFAVQIALRTYRVVHGIAPRTECGDFPVKRAHQVSLTARTTLPRRTCSDASEVIAKY